jgi:hypothetical protein
MNRYCWDQAPIRTAFSFACVSTGHADLMYNLSYIFYAFSNINILHINHAVPLKTGNKLLCLMSFELGQADERGRDADPEPALI